MSWFRVLTWVLFAFPLFAELDFTFNTIPEDQAVLIEEDVLFEALSFSEIPATDFLWDFGDGSQARGETVSHRFQNLGFHLIKLTPVFADGTQGKPCYGSRFVNPAIVPRELWYAHINGEIETPESDTQVLKLGSTFRFQARSDSENARFFWYLEGTQIVHEGPIWDWTIPENLAPDMYYLAMTAVHADGTATPYPEYRRLFFYQNEPPPDGFLSQPQADTDGFYRMNLGQSLSFTAGSEPSLPNTTYRWDIQAHGSFEAGFCVNYDLPDSGPFFGPSFVFEPTMAGYFCLQMITYAPDGAQDPFPVEFQVIVKDGNLPPAGVIPTLSATITLGETIEFTAQGTDPDGDPLQYRWDFGNGTTGEGTAVSVTYTQAGAYAVYLTAIDATGTPDPTPYGRWVLVNDPQLAPINSEPYAAISKPFIEALVEIQTPLTITGAGFDPDGENVELFWDMGNGTLFRNTASPTVTYSNSGYADVLLFARDAKGYAWRNFDELSVFVYQGTPPPNAIILQPSIETGDGEDYSEPFLLAKPGEPVALRGGVVGQQNLDGYFARWGVTSQNTLPQTFSGFQPSPLVLTTPDTYYVNLNVFDPQGVRDPFEAFFFLEIAENFPPTGYIVEPSYDLGIRVGEGITLSGEGFDRDQEALCYEWRVSDGRTFKDQRVENLRFDQPGLYSLSLTISDPHDARFQVPQQVYVTVWPQGNDSDFYPDITRVTPSGFRVTGPQNSSFRFEIEPNDAYTGLAFSDYLWDFGNGQTATGPSPGNITFATPGYYLIRLFTRSASGLWAMYPEEWEVVIYGSNLPPKGTIVEPPLRDKEGFYAARTSPWLINQPLDLKATATDNDGHFPLSIRWELDYESFSTQPEPDPLVFDTRGNYHLQTLVYDSENQSDLTPDFRIIQVVDPNLKPESYIVEPDGDITVEPGDEVYFYGFGEDPNKLEMQYEWNFGPNASPSSAVGEEAYPVVFAQETPPDQPIVVTFRAKTEFTQDPTPAEIRVHVRRFSDSDFEPNDSLSEAMPIRSGNYSSLSLVAGDARDVFEFEVTQPNRDLQVNLRADDLLGLKLYRFENGDWTLLPLDSLRSARDSLIFQNLPEGRYALEFLNATPEGLPKRNISYGLSISTLQPALYLPFAVEDGSLSSSFGVLNPGSSRADIAIVGLDREGRVIETKTQSLEPGERLFRPTLGFFDREGQVEKARQVRWLKIVSTNRLVGFSNSETQDRTQLMSSAAINTLQTSVMVPHIAVETSRWYTRAVLINASPSDQEVTFSAPDEALPLAPLKPDNQSDFRFTDIFEQGLPTWGQFSNPSGQTGLAGIEIFGRVDGAKQVAALEMIDSRRTNPNFTYIRNQIFFPHVAQDTGNFWTGIALINPNPTTAGFSLIGYDSEGNERVRLENQILPPGGKLLDTVENLFNNQTGIAWLLVEADSGVAGFQLFGDHAGKRMAGFPAANFATDYLIFPHLTSSAEEWTGIAVLNVGEENVLATIEAYSDGGVLLATSQRTVAPRTKTVALPQNLFPEGLPPEACYLVIRGDKKTLNGFEIFGTLQPDGSLGEVMAGLSAQTP